MTPQLSTLERVCDLSLEINGSSSETGGQKFNLRLAVA